MKKSPFLAFAFLLSLLSSASFAESAPVTSYSWQGDSLGGPGQSDLEDQDVDALKMDNLPSGKALDAGKSDEELFSIGSFLNSAVKHGKSFVNAAAPHVSSATRYVGKGLKTAGTYAVNAAKDAAPHIKRAAKAGAGYIAENAPKVGRLVSAKVAEFRDSEEGKKIEGVIKQLAEKKGKEFIGDLAQKTMKKIEENEFLSGVMNDVKEIMEKENSPERELGELENELAQAEAESGEVKDDKATPEEYEDEVASTAASASEDLNEDFDEKEAVDLLMELEAQRALQVAQ